MSISDQHIDELFRNGLKKGSTKHSKADEWSKINRHIRLKNFLSFHPNRFNFYYLMAGLVVAAGISYNAWNKTSAKKDEHVSSRKEWTEKIIEEKDFPDNGIFMPLNPIQPIHQLPYDSQRNLHPTNKHQNHHTPSQPKDKQAVTIPKKNTSPNKNSYLRSRNNDSTETMKHPISDSLKKLETKKWNKNIDHDNPTVLHLQQDTIVKKDTNQQQINRFRFRWKTQ